MQLVNKKIKQDKILEEIKYTMEVTIEDDENDVVNLFGDIVEIR